MNEEGAPFDSGFDDTGPFRVSPASGSVSLEAALRDFGPAAIEDLIPRVGELAATLDRAHAQGAVHGALHPRNIFVTDTATLIVAGGHAAAPYAAPEVLDGQAAIAASDQYSLAVIAHEWMTGRPVSAPADRPIDLRAMPAVDRAAMSQAFTRALARVPARRFASCAAFAEALSDSLLVTLPLVADDEDPVEPFVPETPEASAEAPVAAASVVAPVDIDDFDMRDADERREPVPRSREPFESVSLDSPLTPPRPDIETPVPAWQPAAAVVPDRTSARFGGVALIIAALVGSVFGFAAGYMARPRALQTAPIAEGLAPNPGPMGATGATGATDSAGSADSAGSKAAPGSAVKRAEPGERVAPSEPVEPARSGRLLVRSTPSGASVSVDGVPSGETPLTLRELPLGTREIVVSQSGYAPESRLVALTRERPSRSIEVRLSRDAAAAATTRSAPPRPSTPATLGREMGSLVVESRPEGASVLINGQPHGTTPLNVSDLPPGDYNVTMRLQGYRDFATTVRVVAGERARAAARLTEQEQE